MAEISSAEELEALYPDEWAVIVEPDYGPNGELRSGLLVFHSPVQQVAARVADEIRVEHPEVVCMNTTPIIITRLIVGWGPVEESVGAD